MEEPPGGKDRPRGFLFPVPSRVRRGRTGATRPGNRFRQSDSMPRLLVGQFGRAPCLLRRSADCGVYLRFYVPQRADRLERPILLAVDQETRPRVGDNGHPEAEAGSSSTP
jgi:hypothetical protein